MSKPICKECGRDYESPNAVRFLVCPLCHFKLVPHPIDDDYEF